MLPDHYQYGPYPGFDEEMRSADPYLYDGEDRFLGFFGGPFVGGLLGGFIGSSIPPLLYGAGGFGGYPAPFYGPPGFPPYGYYW
ncbi:hypothetical protein [Halobacillus massiliensis]|uniref:hypothetical protein n=1 Tax=Halobacillus massiliensis TaxID=1926286 RepID=UPI001FE2AE14|nr:hypothetical protein [Halobacillus massiliensis]